VKDDSVNHPTFSYKDRVVSVAISKAIEFGFDTVSCASTATRELGVGARRARRAATATSSSPDDLEQGRSSARRSTARAPSPSAATTTT
jgi:threonine synthase